MTSSAECRCWRGPCRGWRPREFVRAASWGLRGAYCRIEGRRVAAAGAPAAPRASAVPGAETLRTSCAFRNTFRVGALSNVALHPCGGGRTDVRRQGLHRLLRNTRDRTPQAHAPEDDEPR